MQGVFISTRCARMLFGICFAFITFGFADAQQLLNNPLPVYGNWCGPDYPQVLANARPPVDPLDAACMRHDYCVAAQGRFDCGCDISLLVELRNTHWSNPYIHNNARGVYDAIALAPCSNPNGLAYKQSMFAKDLISDTVTGRGTPADVFDRWRRLLVGP